MSLSGDIAKKQGYEKLSGDFNNKRLQDLNRTFDECSNHVNK